MERKYSVAEIDSLREVIRNKFLFGKYRLTEGTYTSGAYNGDALEKRTEERVRTHMLAGHTADDLISSESSKKSPQP